MRVIFGLSTAAICLLTGREVEAISLQSSGSIKQDMQTARSSSQAGESCANQLSQIGSLTVNSADSQIKADADSEVGTGVSTRVRSAATTAAQASTSSQAGAGTQGFGDILGGIGKAAGGFMSGLSGAAQKPPPMQQAPPAPNVTIIDASRSLYGQGGLGSTLGETLGGLLKQKGQVPGSCQNGGGGVTNPMGGPNLAQTGAGGMQGLAQTMRGGMMGRPPFNMQGGAPGMANMSQIGRMPGMSPAMGQPGMMAGQPGAGMGGMPNMSQIGRMPMMPQNPQQMATQMAQINQMKQRMGMSQMGQMGLGKKMFAQVASEEVSSGDESPISLAQQNGDLSEQQLLDHDAIFAQIVSMPDCEYEQFLAQLSKELDVEQDQLLGEIERIGQEAPVEEDEDLLAQQELSEFVDESASALDANALI